LLQSYIHSTTILKERISVFVAELCPSVHDSEEHAGADEYTTAIDTQNKA